MTDYEGILKNATAEILIQKKINDSKVFIKQLTTEGANYTSAIFKLILKEDNKDDLHLFGKVASLPESIRSQGEFEQVYILEKHFYEHIAPLYEELQDKYGFKESERYKIPSYFGSHAKSLQETMILEDLEIQQYILYDRFKPVDLDYASTAIETLAKFHALSFAFKYKYPEKYSKDSYMFEWKYKLYCNMKDTFRKTADNVCETLPDDLKYRIKVFVEDSFSDTMLYKYFGPGKWQILVHSDYRASNIMHKYQDGKVSSLIPVDYQTYGFGSPVTDLLYFIYCGTDEDFRKLHLTKLFDLYYNTLSKWLIQMDMSPEEIFSRKDFDEELKDLYGYGLCVSLFLLPIVLIEPDKAPKVDVEGNQLSEFSVQPNELYMKRIIPIINEFSEMGIM